MKTIVVYYSRTGCTRLVAERLAQSLHADLVELKEQTDRRGMWGFIKGGYDAFRRHPTALVPVDTDLSTYDLVVAGSPVWAGTLCPAVRTFLQAAAPSIQRAAFFCTHGGGGASKLYTDAEALVGKPLMATVALRDKAVKGGDVGSATDDFLSQLDAE